MAKADLPLVRLAVLRPFLDIIERKGVNPREVLESVGIPESAFDDPSASVHVIVIHQFLENAASATGDRHLAAGVANTIDLEGWPLLRDAARHATTVADFLARFIDGASEISSSATQYLRIEGQETVLGENRRFASPIPPAQNDAFMASLWVEILNHALGPDFDPSQISVFVCDPKALPAPFKLMRVALADRQGASIRFPTRWTSWPFPKRDEWMVNGSAALADAPPKNLVAAFRQVIRTHIGEGRLTATGAARLVSMSRQKLARLLAAQGTSTSEEIRAVEIEYACEALEKGDRSVAEIALALGYADPSNFARAFRQLVGVAPSRYRQCRSDATARRSG